MRILAAILLLAGGITFLVLGAGHLLGSRAQHFQAQMDAGDLSLVSKDLASAEERRKEHAAAEAKVGSVGRRDLAIGVVLLAFAPLQLAGGILLLLRRARPFVLGAAGLSAAALLGVMMVDRFTHHGLITLGALLVSFLLALLARSRAHRPTT